jgi:hypothetical protein
MDKMQTLGSRSSYHYALRVNKMYRQTTDSCRAIRFNSTYTKIDFCRFLLNASLFNKMYRKL